MEEREEILAVYEQFYKKLLETRPGETDMEKESEVVVGIAMRAMQLLAESERKGEIEMSTVHKVISSLKNKIGKKEGDFLGLGRPTLYLLNN